MEYSIYTKERKGKKSNEENERNYPNARITYEYTKEPQHMQDTFFELPFVSSVSFTCSVNNFMSHTDKQNDRITSRKKPM